MRGLRREKWAVQNVIPGEEGGLERLKQGGGCGGRRKSDEGSSKVGTGAKQPYSGFYFSS